MTKKQKQDIIDFIRDNKDEIRDLLGIDELIAAAKKPPVVIPQPYPVPQPYPEPYPVYPRPYNPTPYLWPHYPSSPWYTTQSDSITGFPAII